MAALQIVALAKGLQIGALEEENIHFTVRQVKSRRPSAHAQPDIYCITYMKFRDVGWQGGSVDVPSLPMMAHWLSPTLHAVP